MGKYVLVAEDDAFLAEIISSSITEHGIAVTKAADGQEAIDHMDAQQPTLLLLDLLMPNVDGHEVLKHIIEKQYSFPTIILSNLSDELNKEACAKAGVENYLIKSDMSEDQLWSVAKKYLQ